MILEFQAKVLDILNVNNRNFIILDKTAFYPTGGGQEHDTGFLITKEGKKFEVVDVIKYKNSILHEVNANFEELKNLINQEVKGVIDKKRRLILTQQHDAVHLLNGVCQEILGKHVWQSGSNVNTKKASLDLTHFKKITDKEIEKIEEKMNEYIFERIPINKVILERTEAEKKYGFRIYQGGAIPSAYLRVVEIENIDIEACGGTHGDNTLEIQSAFLLNVGKIQDNVYRFELVAGLNAYLEYKRIKYLLNESAKIFNVKVDDMPKVSKRFFEEWKEQRKEIEKLSDYLLENAESLIKNSSQKLIDLPLENKYLINLAKKYDKIFKNKNIVVGKKEFLNEIKKLSKEVRESKDLVIGKL
jgi:alanyl-tRNA synthetase